MSFKQFIRLTILSTLIAWGIWFFLILTVDPVFAGLFEFSLFYLTLFLALVGTILFSAVAIRVKVKPETILFRHVVVSFRQSVLLAILTIASFILLSKNLFTWWLMVILILLLSLVEWNAQSMSRRRRDSEHKNASEVSL
ncbi:TPA: hypothetical protein DDZ10_01220 [Candidatus Uhrbacteria bacterium]|nr:MAG: hypothetical protein A3D69_02695 [Candidatus Uhrbacteria bacterium RIFCSPHIGHO2_02_FULL_54_11]HBL39271.1 hypothetical protein [Candidatus Uhrbacteria bacterium]